MTLPAPPFAGGTDPRLDLFLDGLLEGEELAAFERELRDSPGLRRQVELQASVDEGLRGLYGYREAAAFVPLLPPAVLGRVDAADRPVVRAGPALRWRGYAMAAAVLLSVAGLYAVYIGRSTAIDRSLSPETVYAMVEGPEFVCTTDEAFAAAVMDRLGQPLMLAAGGAEGIEAVGWAYGDGYQGEIIGEKTLVLITRVRGEKVLVFMDRVREDRPLSIAPGKGLNLFRRVAGSVVLYEVTPLERAEVIDRLYDPRKGPPPG
jgi:hypothetical protein